MYVGTIEARRLNGARRVLSTIEERAGDLASGDNLSDSELYHLGRLAEAADRAEDAVFNVLNVASSMLSDPVAAKAIDSYRRLLAGQ